MKEPQMNSDVTTTTMGSPILDAGGGLQCLHFLKPLQSPAEAMALRRSFGTALVPIRRWPGVPRCEAAIRLFAFVYLLFRKRGYLCRLVFGCTSPVDFISAVI